MTDPGDQYPPNEPDPQHLASSEGSQEEIDQETNRLSRVVHLEILRELSELEGGSIMPRSFFEAIEEIPESQSIAEALWATRLDQETGDFRPRGKGEISFIGERQLGYTAELYEAGVLSFHSRHPDYAAIFSDPDRRAGAYTELLTQLDRHYAIALVTYDIATEAALRQTLGNTIDPEFMNFKETLVIEILDEGDLTVEDQQALLPLIDRYIAGSSPDIADPVEVAVALAEAASKKIQAEGLESSLIDFLSAMPELQIYLQHDNWSQIQGRLVLYASAQELRNLASEEARESLLADGPARAQGIGISAPDFEEVVRRMCEYRDSLGE